MVEIGRYFPARKFSPNFGRADAIPPPSPRRFQHGRTIGAGTLAQTTEWTYTVPRSGVNALLRYFTLSIENDSTTATNDRAFVQIRYTPFGGENAQIAFLEMARGVVSFFDKFSDAPNLPLGANDVLTCTSFSDNTNAGSNVKTQSSALIVEDVIP